MKLNQVIATGLLAVWLIWGAVIASIVDFVITMGSPPRLWLYLAFGFLWLLPVYAYLHPDNRHTRWPLAAAFLAYIGLGLGLPWGEGDRMLLALSEVRLGMTPAQVSAILGEYERGLPFVPDTSDPEHQRQLDPLGQLFAGADLCQQYRHSEPGREWDIGYVCFAADRVVGIDFHPD